MIAAGVLTLVTLYGAAADYLWWIVPGISAAYVAVAYVWYRFVDRYPGHYPLRRAIPMCSDLGLTAISTHMLGVFSYVYYPVFAYIVIANGVRYGFKYLVFATAAGIAAFSGVFSITQSWPNYYETGAMLAQGLVVAPTVYFVLVHRLHNQKSELEKQVRELSHVASHDPLTGLRTPSFFREIVEREMERSRASGEEFVVLFADLDGFKAVNDVLGHAVGDRVLTSAARCIEMSVRVTDIAARMGGDEFAVLLTGSPQQADVEMVSNRIRDRVSKVCRSQVDCPPISASIGVAAYPKDGETAEELLERADHAMYSNKRSARRTREDQPALS